MQSQSAPKLLLVSGACCSPGLVRLDQVLEKTLQQTLSELRIIAEVRKVSISAVINGGGDVNPAQREQIMTIFQGYGAKFTPALLIADVVRFAGTPPKVGTTQSGPAGDQDCSTLTSNRTRKWMAMLLHAFVSCEGLRFIDRRRVYVSTNRSCA